MKPDKTIKASKADRTEATALTASLEYKLCGVYHPFNPVAKDLDKLLTRFNELNFAIWEQGSGPEQRLTGPLLFQLLGRNKTVTSLNLEGNLIVDKEFPALCELLSTNSTITYLNLDRVIDDAKMRPLVQALASKNSITSLSLVSGFSRVDEKRTFLGDEGLKFLCEYLKTPKCSLKKLNIRDLYKIGQEGLTALGSSLVHASLTSLDISENKIGDAGAQILCKALKVNKSLTFLDISENKIGDAGAQILCKALKVNTTLTSLVIRDNPIKLVGMEALSQTLKSFNKTLTKLYMDSDIGAKSKYPALEADILASIERNELSKVKEQDHAYNDAGEILPIETLGNEIPW